MKFEYKHWREVIGEYRSNPRALWQKLSGGAMPPCPIDDPDGWRSHFERLYNHDQHTPNSKNEQMSRAIFNFINGVRLDAPEVELMSCDAVQTRKAIADEILNIPFGLGEVQEYGKWQGQGTRKGPCGML